MCGKVRGGARLKVQDENGALERHQLLLLASSSLSSASRRTAAAAFLKKTLGDTNQVSAGRCGAMVGLKMDGSTYLGPWVELQPPQRR